MLRLVLALALATAATGCAGDNCSDGVCPDPAYATLRPGPCESGYSDAWVNRRCVYHYDGDTLIEVDCTWQETAADGEHGTDKTTWTYDPSGGPAKFQTFHDDVSDGIGSYGSGLAWGPDQVQTIGLSYDGTSQVRATYERASFQLFPMLGSEVMAPEVDWTTATRVGVTYTITQNGSTFTRTPSNGDPAITYDLDAAGRVTRWTDGNVTETTTYTADRITARTADENGQHAAWTYDYDRAGNVAGWTQSGRSEAYSYSCW